MSKVIDFDKANNKSKSRDIRKNTEYFIGLDIGTSSVGWAVTNTKYEVIKFNGKKMWGSRLFAEASTAEDRRVHRTNRRRLQRRVDRINLLEEIFSEEMSKVDPEFFIRLKESKFHLEDKVIDEKNIIFKEKEDGDKKFYEKYPTIYHLRHALIEGCDDIDIRELYMAVHHIIKYRGHFLFKGDISDSGLSINDKIVEIIDLMSSVAGMNRSEYNDKLINEIRNIVCNRDKTINDKKKDINKVFAGNDYKAYKSIFSLAVGASVKPYDIFLEEEYKDLDDVKSMSFKNTEYEEVRDTYEQAFEDRIILIDAAKSLYDMIVLLSIKPEGKGLSENKVDIYNKHHEDLEMLKEVLKKDMTIYNRVLREDKDKGTNYINYIKKSKYGKGCSREDFYKFLKKALGELESNEKIEYILSEIELERFLSLQRLKENSIIPYQIHRYELKKILDNASSKFEFLNKESEGYSNIEKIIKLMEFRIPYYVGPLNNHHSVDNKEEQGFSWVVRKGPGRVKPWNFEQLVDKRASSMRFKENLTNKCTYLIRENVLPKESLLYSEYCLLNELNNIMYDGKKLSLEVKNDLIEKVYKKEKKKLTKKGIKDFLKHNNYADGKGEVTGIDIDIKSDFIKEGGRDYSLNNIFKYPLQKNKNIIWDPVTSMDTVKKMMKSNDVRVTKKSFVKKGSLYNETIYKASVTKKGSYFPLKLSDARLLDLKKYGGYSSIRIAFFTIISYDEISKKNKRNIVRAVPIPIYISESAESFNDIEKYIKHNIIEDSKKRRENFKVIYKKLLINTVIDVNGFRYYVTGGKQKEIHIKSAIQLLLEEEITTLIGKIVKFCDSNYLRKNSKYITEENTLKVYEYLMKKLDSSYYRNKRFSKDVCKLKEQTTKDNFKKLSLEEQCSVLLEILNILVDANKYNLNKLGFSINKSTIGINLTTNESFKVINQSITGLFENEIDILG